MDASWRHPENLSDARWIDIAYMEKFRRYVPCVDNFGLAGFGKYGFFCHVKFLGDDTEDMVGKFGNLRHSVV